MTIFTEKEKRTLKGLGKSSFGVPLLEMFERMKKEMSDIDDITGDYAAQVEGRKIFKRFLKEITDKIKTEDIKKPQPTKGDDDYE